MGQDSPIKFDPSPFVWRDPATIPRRKFLYGFELRRKQLSALIAPGAAGKTTLKVGRALCMVTGKDYLGHRVWNGPHRVWLWNLEDEREEVEKTVHAFLKLWNLTEDDLGGRLFIDGSDYLGSPLLKLVTEVQGAAGAVVNRPVVGAVIEAMRARRIDYLDVDPFVSSHSVDENNNPAMDMVAKEWVKVAVATDAAIGLAHHVRKPPVNGGETTSMDARGAGSVVNAARSCLVINRMSVQAAIELGIPSCDRKRYISVYDDKNNKAPPALKAHWYEFVGLGLGNADATGPEDNIGALKVWEAPDAMAGVSPSQLLSIQQMIQKSPEKARKHSASTAWVGKLVAFVLDLNLDNATDDARVKLCVRTWIENGALRSVAKYDDKAKRDVEYVEVGNLAIVDHA